MNSFSLNVSLFSCFNGKRGFNQKGLFTVSMSPSGLTLLFHLNFSALMTLLYNSGPTTPKQQIFKKCIKKIKFGNAVVTSAFTAVLSPICRVRLCLGCSWFRCRAGFPCQEAKGSDTNKACCCLRVVDSNEWALDHMSNGFRAFNLTFELF